MAENLRPAAFLPLVRRRQRAQHALMTFYVLLSILILVAALAPRFGADSRRDDCHCW
jgi:hypothetical protein